MTSPLHNALSSTPDLSVHRDESISTHTTYGIGGDANLYLEVGTRGALANALKLLDEHETPYLVLGNGSNVLFADQPYPGAVIHLGHGFDQAHIERSDEASGDHTLEVGAAMSITRLLRLAKDEQISGVEFLGGIPGTVGGAVRMNAGTVMGEVSDTLMAASWMLPGQGEQWVAAADLGLAYRHSVLPAGAVITGARFRCRDADPSMRERLNKVLSYRKETQPLQAASCGSVFANPPGDHAGRLIEACGLKGRRIGGAQISEVHANWIINDGDAKATDVRDLIDLCISEVQRRHDVTLRHEVQLLGEWAGGGS